MGPTEDDKQINFQDLEDINMRLRGQFVWQDDYQARMAPS